jgi:CHAT domain-containing protein/tetratricopeptide (TPR) repeat protein
MQRVVSLLFAILPLAAQSPAKLLPPHSLASESLSGDERRTYRLQVPDGQVVVFSIREQNGLAGMLAVLKQDGSELVEADLTRRIPATKSVLIGAGDFLIRLGPGNHSSMTRTFQISVSEPRLLSEKDQLRFSAERLIGEAEASLRSFQPGYLKDAQTKYESALALWKLIGDLPQQVDALCRIGFVLRFQGEMKASPVMYQRALDLTKTENDVYGTAVALLGLAFVSYDTAQYSKATEFATQALELDRALDDAGIQSDALSVLGLSSMAKGDNEHARITFEAMRKQAEKAGDRVREADSYNDLGLLEFQLGNFTDGAAHYSHALTIDREENERVRVAQELNNLGVLYSNTGDQREALLYLEEALPIRKELAQPGSYANTLYNIAVTRADLGEYQQALDGYNAALLIFRSVAHRAGEAYTLQEQGRVFVSLGENSKAEDLLRQALAIRRAISDRRGEVQTLSVLGDIHSRERHYSQAFEELHEALSISRTAGYQREQAQVLGDLASTLLRTGDARSSLDSSAESLEWSRKTGDRMAEGQALHLEGVAWTRLGEAPRAREALDQALVIRRAISSPSLEAETLLDLARLDIEVGLLPQSAQHVLDGLNLVESLRANLGSRERRLRFTASHRSFYDLAIDVEMQLHDVAKAFELSERARARGLVDLLGESRIDLRKGVDPALLAQERHVQELLDAKHERLMRLLSGKHSAARETADGREIDLLLDRYDAVESAIRFKSPQYAALMRPQPLSLSEIQALIPNVQTSLIEFWLGEKRGFVWIVSKTQCQGFPLPARAEIETLARRGYEALNARNLIDGGTLAQREQRLSGASAEFGRIAASLAAQLLGPLRGRLAARRLWIVPDGALAYLPFAALPEPGSGKLLVIGHEIVGLPSASVLAAIRAQIKGRHPTNLTAAVFADPVFRANDERVTAHQPIAFDKDAARAAADAGIADLPRLHFSRQEAAAIYQLAPPRQTLEKLDFDASAAEVKTMDLSRFRLIHFATHGLLDSQHPDLSGIILSLIDRNGNPQDGFLRLHEIYNLKLNADLVVLSACQTALGEEVRSEGLIGLARGFMYAGSPQILASLWSVRDRATAILMHRFYESLLDRHLTAAAALRSAQLSMIRDSRWSDPYYWAAFTLQGSL